MQLRKLHRLIGELIEKKPYAAYKKVCIDTRYGVHNKDYTFYEIKDMELHQCNFTDADGFPNDNETQVVVLGNY